MKNFGYRATMRRGPSAPALGYGRRLHRDIKIYLLNILILFTPFAVLAQKIVTVAGNGTSGDSGDGGAAIIAQINPVGITLDRAGNIYVTVDCSVRKINTAGIITTIAGTGICGYSGDGGPATAAEVDAPAGILVDSVGNIYFSAWGGNVVRKINTSGIISTIAGIGAGGSFSGDGGPATAAGLAAPYGLLKDKSDNIYIADLGNDRIRKIDPAGNITTIAGTTSGYSGDGGPATAAQLRYPSYMALGPGGDMYFCQWPHGVVRKIDAAGMISTVAGNGIPGYSGDNGPATNAQLKHPFGITIDSLGNIYIAENESHVVRKVDALTGIITTLAGTGTAGYAGDGGPASAAQLKYPNCLFFDRAGNLYINDASNHRIRKIIYNLVSINEIGKSGEYYIFPNPSQNMLQIGGLAAPVLYSLRNATGATVAKGTLSPGTAGIDISLLPEGTYMLELTDENGKSTASKVIKMQR